ncbi:uncharacterized protein EV422DRAFT_569924 [Fimicolochytrium jonesii]|uniref:uncharacterized protein n=1 Tax=Fimicolochytrium jonesii TaxID=1396493 RepID=UPI0022FE607F|nr:uncharacterized protein EV422DRAFT_569924 [Fimicolochytrium jonesii]KAI8818139.1 hypothetical protein EV422DRAFT_569924 [Fimicolochytrium jonesii]
MSDTTPAPTVGAPSGDQVVIEQVDAAPETSSQQPPPQETGDGPPAADEAPADAAPAPAEVPQNTRPPKGTDLGILVTPAQAVELHRRAEEIKNGYALLAMKRLENVFAGMDTEDADGAEQQEGDETVNMQLEEEKLNAALASYQTHLGEVGIQSGTPEYDAAMVALGMSGAEEEEEPEAAAAPEVTPTVEPAVKLVVEEKPLPYHDVWKDGNGPAEQRRTAITQEAPAPTEDVATDTAAPAVEAVSVSAEPTPVADVKVEAKNVAEEEPEQKPTTPAAPAKAASKKLPPVVRPVRGGRAGAGASRQQLAPKQALAPRTLALNFSSFGAGLPGDGLKAGQTAAKPAFSGPSGNALIANFVPHAIQSAISQIPADANVLRGIHPTASTTRAHYQPGNGASPLTNFGGGPAMRIGGAPGGMVVAAAPGSNIGKFNWHSSQQSQSQYEQSRKRASVPYTAGLGTGLAPGGQRARSGNSPNADSSIPRNTSRPFGADAAVGAGQPQMPSPADGQLPPLKSAGGMKITLQAGAAMRRTNNIH